MPLVVKIYDQEAQAVGEMNLPDKVFGVRANEALVHQAMVAQMANERQVLAHTKDRSEVRGGGKKPWRQKGTGRARAGSIRSPLWIGGGVTFGPRKERNFKKNINKKMKQRAMLMVLSDRLASGSFVVVNELKFDEYKTKSMDRILRNLENLFSRQTDAKNPGKEKKTGAQSGKKTKRSLVVLYGAKSETVKYSGRNLAGVKMLNADNLNIVDLLAHRYLIATAESVRRIEQTYSAR